MDALEFEEVARLLNHSKTILIDLDQPVRASRHGRLYSAEHRVHKSRYPFQLLYLDSRATTSDISEASEWVPDVTNVDVVYAASLDQRVRKHRQLFHKRARTFLTIREYLASFLADDLQGYREKLRSQLPPDYVHPKVLPPAGNRRRVPNPLHDLLIDPDPSGNLQRGVLGVVLAEAGQGKSYMCRHLVGSIAKHRGDQVPVFVDSSQWQRIAVQDLEILEKTIVHSFNHFDAPIGWLGGHEGEFLRIAFKANLFRLVFDGFDEYILRNWGRIEPLEVLETLAVLARETGARMVITARTSFWEASLPEHELDAFVGSSGALIYKILPFEIAQARQYFERRFSESGVAERAATIFGQLWSHNKELLGRGFALSLVGDLLERDATNDIQGISPGNGLVWLMEKLCEREERRQNLRLSGTQQMQLFRTGATEIACGVDLDMDVFQLAIALISHELPRSEMLEELEKLKSHPLIEFDDATAQWRFRQEQVQTALLALEIIEEGSASTRKIAECLSIGGAGRHDLAQMIVDAVCRSSAPLLKCLTIQEIVAQLAPTVGGRAASDDARHVAGLVAVAAVDRLAQRGSTRDERRAALIDVFGSPVISGVHFGGTIASISLAGIRFVNCRFERLTWANCIFDGSTVFERCEFIGGRIVRSPGLANVELLDCVLDREADSMFTHETINEGKKQYTAADLAADIKLIIEKFVKKGGVVVRSIEQRNVLKGPVGTSRFHATILESLESTVLEKHSLSGSSSQGYNIRPTAVDAVRFFSDNNVFTGPLEEAFDRARRKLKL